MAQFLKDEVKEKIKASAVEVFTDKGFQQASIKEIAANAHVSVGNVYRYYKNKDALYCAVIEGVSNGVVDILKTVEANDNYKMLLTGDEISPQVYEPMLMFTRLYKQEQKVFEMLIKNGVDQHYEMTVSRIIDILKDYFYRFWGSEIPGEGMSRIEVSALTNAIVFSVIDLLNHFSDDVLNEQLMTFVTRMIRGYFWAKQKEGDNQ